MGFWMQFVQPSTKLPDWYEPTDPDYPDQYQLSIQGMDAIDWAMDFMRVLDVGVRHPEFPRWEDVGLDRERGQELFQFWVYRPSPGEQTIDDVIKPHERQPYHEYITRFEAATGQSAPPNKALGYKFMSCDGWHVKPDECLAIADAITSGLLNDLDILVSAMDECGYPHTNESFIGLLSPWSTYNRAAALFGGYRVW